MNRLDNPVSGISIITFNNSNLVHDVLDKAEKVYIAKVAGRIPDNATVDESI